MSLLYQFIGYRLKRDIFNDSGIVLLSAGTFLTVEHIDKLENHQMNLMKADVFRDENQVVKASGLYVQQATEQVKEIFHYAHSHNRIPLIDVRNKIVPAIQQATENPNLYMLFLTLQSKDDYTFRHNIGVGVIATLIGKWLNFSEADLNLLTLAATLHDIGKTKIPDEILNKPDKYTDKEYEMMKKHTIYGYELIKNTVGVSHRLALVALQHHEREDGGGYPFGLKSEGIDFFSKIVAIADVFHAMSSNRVYHDAAPFYLVLEQMKEGIFGKFHPTTMSLFLKRIMESLVGNDVILSDGRMGKILMINPFDPTKPVIQIGKQVIDLSRERNHHMEKVVPS